MTTLKAVLLGLLIPGVLVAAAAAPAWELVGAVGLLRVVYVEPSHIKDTRFLADVVSQMYAKFGKEQAMQIDFFDDRDAAPKTVPYTSAQRRHQRAKFNFNPKNGMQRFVWLDLVPVPNDPTKLRIKETEEKLPLP